MPHLSPFQRTALATVLSFIAAAAIVACPPAPSANAGNVPAARLPLIADLALPP